MGKNIQCFQAYSKMRNQGHNLICRQDYSSVPLYNISLQYFKTQKKTINHNIGLSRNALTLQEGFQLIIPLTSSLKTEIKQ